MAYDGEYLNVCMVQAFDFNNTSAVTVSGDTWNPCGHMLLNVGADAGFYFHVAGLRSQPKYMTSSGFQRYLAETGKTVLRRMVIHIDNPKGAQARLDERLSKPWLWAVVPNNCVAFVEDVVNAGGAKNSLYFNCPSREAFT